MRSIDRYFAALVRSAFAEYRRLRATRDASGALLQRLHDEQQDADRDQAARCADPALWLRQALDVLAVQWLPGDQQLLFDGAGLGVAWISGALDLLLSRVGRLATHDIGCVIEDSNKRQNLKIPKFDRRRDASPPRLF